MPTTNVRTTTPKLKMGHFVRHLGCRESSRPVITATTQLQTERSLDVLVLTLIPTQTLACLPELLRVGSVDQALHFFGSQPLPVRLFEEDV